jgi:hypothetical protein
MTRPPRMIRSYFAAKALGIRANAAALAAAMRNSRQFNIVASQLVREILGRELRQRCWTRRPCLSTTERHASADRGQLPPIRSFV